MNISVIIPTHNRRHLVGNALDSVLAQTRPPDEVILVDDRSTDDTAAYVQRQYPQVSLLSTDFGNAASARHAGIEHSRGDWLAFLDSDDRWDPQHLQRAEEVLTGSDDIAYLAHRDFCRGDFHPSKRLEGQRLLFDGPMTGLSHTRFVELISQNRGFSLITLVIAKARYYACGGFDSTQIRRHDIDLFFRAIHDQTWSYNPETQACARLGDDDRISANRLECDFYYLRCLVRSKSLYATDPVMRQLRRRAAAIAAGSAGRARDCETLRRVLDLSGADLPTWKRVAWSLIAVGLGFTGYPK